jgi:hypothetical protein
MSKRPTGLPAPLLLEGSNDLPYWEWETQCANITKAMDKISSNAPMPGYWMCFTKDQGWEKKVGWKTFRAKTGEELLMAILPKTDCTFRIYADMKRHRLYLNNAHHDSPVWREWYLIMPAKEDAVFE